MEKGRDARTVALDMGDGPGLTRLGQGDRPALGVRVAAELRQPVGEGEGWVSQSASEGLFQLGRARVTPKLDEEVRDRRSRKPGSEMSDEEKDGRHAHQGERDPAGFVPSRRSERHHHGCRDQRRQRKAETGDEKLEREPDRTARRSPAQDEGHDGRERDDSDRNALSPKDDVTAAAGHPAQQPHEIENDEDRVRGDDNEAIEPANEPPARIGEKHVNEHQGRQQEDRLADHLEHCGVGLGQPRKRGNETRGHQQWAESALGPPRPGNQSAADVSQDDPADEGGVDVRKGAVVAGQAQPVRADRGGESGQCHAEEDRVARRAASRPSSLRRTLLRVGSPWRLHSPPGV